MTDTFFAPRIERTVRIVAAYVGNNHVARSDLAGLIGTVFGAIGKGLAPDASVADSALQAPAVSIRKSVTPDFIICLEDGQSFKSMKRHLATKFGLTPEEYRSKWGLPRDYPMVAANYAAKRSALAVKLGLGRRTGDGEVTPVAARQGRPIKGAPKAAA